MTLMFQKEVGQKTYLRNIKNEMNGLLVLSQNFFNPKQLIKVSPGCFSPPPKVNSIVISYQRKNKPLIPLTDFLNYQRFLRKLFEHKRKKMLPMLKRNYNSIVWENQLKELNIDFNIRAEDLSHEQIQSLFTGMKHG